MLDHAAALALLLVALCACDSPKPNATTGAQTAAVAQGTATSHAAPAQGAPLTERSFGDIVAGAASVKVTSQNKTVEVKEAKDVAAVVAALGAGSKPTTSMPRCMTPHRLVFLDATGKELATIGLCDSEGLAENQRSMARIDLPAGGGMAGFTVADLAALRGTLEPLGIKLP